MKKLLWLFAFLLFASAAQAQFADQRQYASASGGSANAQTVVIPNYALNPGVMIRFKASFTNTGAMTLAVNGTAAKAVKVPARSGLLALSGGEVMTGEVATVVYDGTQYELLSFNGDASVFPTVTIGAGQAITSSGPGGALTAVAYSSFGTAAGNAVQGGAIVAGGPIGSATTVPIITYNAAGQVTAVTTAIIAPNIANVAGLGAGVESALVAVLNGAGGLAPTASPVFTGTITAPDAGTWSAAGLAAAAITDQALTVQGSVCNSAAGVLSTVRGHCANAVPALTISTHVSPTAPSSTTYAMQGLAGTITPASSGTIIITFSINGLHN